MVAALAQPLRMLIVGMADLAGGALGQGRDVHAVVIDQPQSQRAALAAGHQQDVAVLQIAVRHVGVAQFLGQTNPHLRQSIQQHRLVQLLADELVETETLDPAHFDERIPLAVDADAFIEKVELDHEGALRLAQVFADGLVARMQTGDGAREALDGPTLVVGALNLVDIGEVAGMRTRQTEQIADGLPLAQIVVAEAQLRILHGSIVIRGVRPGHRQLLRQPFRLATLRRSVANNDASTKRR